jgi:NAD(P)-dependent dehydrogenase (short-subunit alcohol dehydrogenase family)
MVSDGDGGRVGGRGVRHGFEEVAVSRLAGKSTVVTGAGRGLGAAVAELFARQGAGVVVSDIDGASADATARRIVDAGGEALGLRVDVTSAADAERLAEAAVDCFGSLDVLVNNAGVAGAGSVSDVSPEEWDRVMAINVKGSYLCSRAAVAHMARSGGGSIVCIASASGVIGQRGQVAYNVSKHAVIGLVRCMALDHAADGIRVNAVCPGVMRTPMLDALSAEQLAALEAMHPLGRMADPAEIAVAVLHLAADESSFTTGAAFLVDGGLTAM